MQSGVAQVSIDHSTTFSQTNSSEDAVLLRAGPREGEVAKTRVSWWVVACDKDWDSFAENGFQELGASLVRDRCAEVAGHEPGQDDSDGVDNADIDGDVVDVLGTVDVGDVVDADNKPFYNGIDGPWVNKLVKGGLGG